jgi:peptidyl-Lys metalloendopeptidase
VLLTIFAEGLAPEFTGVIVRYIPEVAAKSQDAEAFTILAPGAVVDVTHEGE